MDKEEIQRVFTRNLKRFMERDHINQTELARSLGASVGQVSAWVHGVHVPRTNHLAAMTVLFGCEASDLLTDKSRNPPSTKDSGLPEEYAELSPANRELVDSLIRQLAKSESENQLATGHAHSKSRRD